MNRVALVRDPLYLKHSNGPGHPESPDRLLAIDRMLADFPLRDRLVEVPARDARREELARVHTEEHLRRIEATRARAFTVLDPDTSATADSHAAAVRAAGGVLAAVEAVLARRVCRRLRRRPAARAPRRGRPRHGLLPVQQRRRRQPRSALRERGLARVLVVDWDVHHGNGTMHSFYDEPGGALLFGPPVPALPGHGPARGDRPRGRGRATR